MLLDYWPLFVEEGASAAFHGEPLTIHRRRRAVLTYRLTIIATTGRRAVFDPDEWLIIDDPTLS